MIRRTRTRPESAQHQCTNPVGGVRFQTPDNSSDCELGFELAPTSEHVFVCPQNRLLPAVNYPILIRAYSDLEQSTELTTLETGLRFDAADIQAAGL